MPKKKYIVSLTEAQRQNLEQFVMTGVAAAYAINHARILLKAKINQPGGSWLDEAISSAIDVSVATIERIRKQFVTEGLEPCLKQRPANALVLVLWFASMKAANNCSKKSKRNCRLNLENLDAMTINMSAMACAICL